MKTATGLILWFLKRSGALAITMPWKVIYCRPGSEDNTKLLRHEEEHIRQIERDGAIKWTVLVLWYLLRYGYKNSPYEIDARNISGL